GASTAPTSANRSGPGTRSGSPRGGTRSRFGCGTPTGAPAPRARSRCTDHEEEVEESRNVNHLLTLVVFLPLVGALLGLLIPREEEGLARALGLATSTVTFVASLGLLAGFDAQTAGFQLETNVPWADTVGIRYHIGIDGISLWLVLLTTFLTPITLLSATHAVSKKVREFVISMLLLETGMLGTFVALDLFLFYVFWELMLIPMYFIIGIWGGDRRVYASIKFVIYTMVGSLLMLVAIVYLYAKYHEVSGTWSFDYTDISRLVVSTPAQFLCFLAFGLAFAIKVPLWPLHTWLP